jgi:peptidoglycan/xylan/chitin deacetylase (PgdA/CDA1 family)
MLQRLLNAANSRITNLWPAKLNFGKLRAPIATISFDDFPRSAWTVGGRILESHGIRGTYFVSAAFSPDRLRNGAAYGITPGVTYYELDDLAAAYERGHEIGCHTFDHIRAPELTNEALEQSLARNAEFVRHHLGDVIMTSFAFPQGAANVRVKRLASDHFAVCRGTWPGINKGLFDLSLLRAVAIDADFEKKFRLADIIQRAKAENAWVVFFTHDVDDHPSTWGCTPKVLDSVVSQLLEQGIEVLPLKNALARVIFG